ncbi:MAG: peptidoglycan DD-metalloendopeptidase family protein [SAR324 cluster bacterium]|nr:peptidoglycan DD-metalloendopeptidase family protein [SAR324 cluster bacterium]
MRNFFSLVRLGYLIFAILSVMGLRQNVDASTVDHHQQKAKILTSIRQSQSRIINMQSSLKYLNNNITTLEQRIFSLEKQISFLENDLIELRGRQVIITKSLKDNRIKLKKELKLLITYHKSSQQSIYPDFDFFRKFFRNNKILKQITRQTKNDINNFEKLKIDLADSEVKLAYAHQALDGKITETNLVRDEMYVEQEQKLIFLTLLEEEKQESITSAKIIDAQIKNALAVINAKKAKQQDIDKTNDKANKVASNKKKPNKIRKKSLPLPIKGLLLQNFGANAPDDLKSYQRGVLISVDSAQEVVTSILDGIVIAIKPAKDSLYTVVVDHDLGVYSVYSLLSEVKVKVDQKIKQSAELGVISSGNAVGGRIFYFELQIGYQAVNPSLWLIKGGWR